jgi:Fic family protein
MRVLAALEEGLPENNLRGQLLHLHALLTGSTQSGFRTGYVGFRSRRVHSPMHTKRTPPEQVGASLDDLDHNICRNTSLDPFVRAVLVYYEVLNIHPFEDGNGRLARAYFSHSLRDYLGLSLTVDLTRVMRSNFRDYNTLLRADRSAETYRRFVTLFCAFLSVELQHIMRIERALSSLVEGDQSKFRGIVTSALTCITEGFLRKRLTSTTEPVKHLLTSVLT